MALTVLFDRLFTKVGGGDARVFFEDSAKIGEFIKTGGVANIRDG